MYATKVVAVLAFAAVANMVAGCGFSCDGSGNRRSILGSCGRRYDQGSLQVIGSGVQPISVYEVESSPVLVQSYQSVPILEVDRVQTIGNCNSCGSIDTIVPINIGGSIRGSCNSCGSIC